MIKKCEIVLKNDHCFVVKTPDGVKIQFPNSVYHEIDGAVYVDINTDPAYSKVVAEKPKKKKSAKPVEVPEVASSDEENPL